MGGELGGAQKCLHRIRRNDSKLAEGGFINFSGAGHSRRVRHGRDRAALGLADFEHDDGLLPTHENGVRGRETAGRS